MDIQICLFEPDHLLQLSKKIKGSIQGPKGMPDQEISVQNKDKQPKNLKK